MRDSKSLLGPRIMAGSARGIELLVPESARPITGRIKQSVFDSLAELVTDASVLDLFAGAGNMGIEALSRGASNCVFVDSSSEATEIIQKNLLKTRLMEKGRVLRKFGDKYLKEARETYDIIFLDPPFDTAHEFPIHLLLKVMNSKSIVVWRKPKEQSIEHLPKSLEVVYKDKFGSSDILYLAAPSLQNSRD